MKNLIIRVSMQAIAESEAKDVSGHAKNILESGGVLSENGRNEIINLDNLLRRGKKSFAHAKQISM